MRFTWTGVVLPGSDGSNNLLKFTELRWYLPQQLLETGMVDGSPIERALLETENN
jgi:hypothetical protein